MTWWERGREKGTRIWDNTFTWCYSEVGKLPCFDVEVPKVCLDKWKELYEQYRQEMCTALQQGPEGKNEAADEVIKKYKMVIIYASLNSQFFTCMKSHLHPWKLETPFPFPVSPNHFYRRYCMELQSLKKVKGWWKKSLTRLLQYITSLTIMPRPDPRAIVALLGRLQVHPWFSYMPRKEVKDPWSVSPLFCERYLIKGDIVLSTIGIRDNIHSQVARVCYVWKTKSSSCSSIFFTPDYYSL